MTGAEPSRLRPSSDGSSAGWARRPGDRAARAFAALLATVFLVFHLPYLPSTLEDLDSINFALGVHRFDVARHQPHPPGYPLFIAVAKASRVAIPSDAKALAAVSVAAGGLGVLGIAALFNRLARESPGFPAWAATGLAVTSPLYWFTAVRPLSDTAGLAAAVGLQAVLAATPAGGTLNIAAFLAGLAVGIRSQILWLTVPLLVMRLADGRVLRRPLLGFVAGILIWLVPLVVLSGGPAAYWQAVSSQGSEDLSGIRMLWTTPTGRELVDALYYAFVAPWATWPIAAVMLIFAMVGVVRLWRRGRLALVLLAVAFGPYLIFDILFQETFTIRYALPLVVPMAFLAAAGVAALPRYPAVAVVVFVVMFDAHIGGRSVAAYARQPAPVFRMLADMRTAAEALTPPPVLAPDRRQMFDLRRPLAWLAAGAPRIERQLAAPPQHEWLEAVDYWNSGGRAPVWFVVDPRRAAIDLVQHGDPARYRWSLPQPIVMSGTRPDEADWYRVEKPEWYLGTGWALTPEAAGVSEAAGRGLQAGPLDGWVNHSVFGGGAILIGGRNFDPTERPRVAVTVDQVQWSRTLQVAPGFFSDVIRLPMMDFDEGVPEYIKLTVSVSPPSRVAIEQFDASKARGVLAFGDGWHEREYDPASGRLWRWLSDRGEVRYLTPAGDWNLHIEGESPRKYYTRNSRIVVRQNGAALREINVGDDFSFDVPVERAYLSPSTLTIETDQTHVPAATSWRGSKDLRKLGLRIYRCELRRR